MLSTMIQTITPEKKPKNLTTLKDCDGEYIVPNKTQILKTVNKMIINLLL
jgi:hypothetical protein